MNDIYTKERRRFVKANYPHVYVQSVMTVDQLIDCLSLASGVLLVAVLLTL